MGFTTHTIQVVKRLRPVSACDVTITHYSRTAGLEIPPDPIFVQGPRDHFDIFPPFRALICFSLSY